MKVWYFHGLESKVGGPKVDFLKEVATEVYAPEMNYSRHKLFGELFRKITKEGSPDLIIGSSMGGFFADALASHFGINTIDELPGAKELKRVMSKKTKMTSTMLEVEAELQDCPSVEEQ